MKKLAILGAALSISCLSVDAAELTSAVGATSQGGGTARLALGFDWEKSWFQTSIGKVTGYWDLGYTYWQAGDQAGGRHSVSFAPVFVYEFGEGNIKPFIEAGIGASIFSGTNAGDQNFGSAFNFEDRIGAGLKIGNTQKIGIRAIHYSNASIKQPNDGIESYSLFYSHSL
ncbi:MULTISPECIES: acyloxyacyl hydrolase [Pseudomonas]|jgi:lipid A 3-O-deacylase|uniref:Acyloxyacyl hydrolase n=3 Tax=Pseudomonas fluorescens group TaxID=136843 RepID=A0ABS0UHH0_9PSED|nr:MULTISPECIES: acyloxyacyl hydrolase [Pseudomonas]SBW84086.1 aldehyde dehydrogenase [Pseudomonas veronii 1YdBTEX2]HBO7832596.1 acyloxyacyl hydrolase [Pseudomonas aeruginosa]KWV73769.1 Lipid A deacylase PagL precursor [Pseudomonas fluorescens]MBI6554882.1 acyloxyacyl hydrolase [Pseudomonas veronii]MBI6565027.1 acyloxyacyl hydrolase [Pseudomonas synxantha]